MTVDKSAKFLARGLVDFIRYSQGITMTEEQIASVELVAASALKQLADDIAMRRVK